MAFYSANTLTFKSRLSEWRVGPNMSSMIGRILLLTVTVGRKSPLTVCQIFLVTKPLFVYLIKAGLSFCVCHIYVRALHPSMAVIRNQPWFLKREIQVMKYTKTHTGHSRTTAALISCDDQGWANLLVEISVKGMSRCSDLS